jgi:hypothetical protein
MQINLLLLMHFTNLFWYSFQLNTFFLLDTLFCKHGWNKVILKGFFSKFTFFVEIFIFLVLLQWPLGSLQKLVIENEIGWFEMIKLTKTSKFKMLHQLVCVIEEKIWDLNLGFCGDAILYVVLTLQSKSCEYLIHYLLKLLGLFFITFHHQNIVLSFCGLVGL